MPRVHHDRVNSVGREHPRTPSVAGSRAGRRSHCRASHRRRRGHRSTRPETASGRTHSSPPIIRNRRGRRHRGKPFPLLRQSTGTLSAQPPLENHPEAGSRRTQRTHRFAATSACSARCSARCSSSRRARRCSTRRSGSARCARARATSATAGERPRGGRARSTPDDQAKVLRAFALYFQLANLAEQHHRLRRRREYEHEELVPRESLDEAFALLDGVPEDELRGGSSDVSLELVLTAHPTEATRRTLLAAHVRIADAARRRSTTRCSRRASARRSRRRSPRRSRSSGRPTRCAASGRA